MLRIDVWWLVRPGRPSVPSAISPYLSVRWRLTSQLFCVLMRCARVGVVLDTRCVESFA